MSQSQESFNKNSHRKGMVREVVNCLSFVILKERVKLNPYISFFTLQFGKYQQFWKVHNFLYLFGEKKKKKAGVPLSSASVLCEKHIKPRKVRFSKAYGAHSAC